MSTANDYGLFFNGTIRKAIIGFSAMFNEIYTVVDEPDPSDRNIRRKRNYLVPVRLTTAEKFIGFYRDNPETRRQIKTALPVIGFNVTGMNIDPERTKLPMNKIYSTDGQEWIFQPVPVTYTAEVNIFSKTLGEMYDIIEWIIPRYQTARSFPLIQWKFTDGSQIQSDMMVSLDGTNFDFTTTDLSAQDGERIIQASLTFNLTSHIYHVIVNNYGPTTGSFSGPNSEQASGLVGTRGNGSANGKVIKTIDLEFESIIGKKFEEMQILSDGTKTMISTIEDNA